MFFTFVFYSISDANLQFASENVLELTRGKKTNEHGLTCHRIDLGYEPEWSVQEGMEKTIEWYVKHAM